MRAAFLRVLDSIEKDTTLLRRARVADGAFRVDPCEFRSVPRSPFCYWAPPAVLALFRTLKGTDDGTRVARFGASTKSDLRFLRLWWEPALSLPLETSSWVPHAKGGARALYYSDLPLSLAWRNDGKELKAFLSDYRSARGWGDQWSAELKGSSLYFEPGLTWSRRTQGGLSFRAMPQGVVFGDKGPAVFLLGGCTNERLSVLAVLSSTAYVSLVQLQMSFGSYEVGVIKHTPYPNVGQRDEDRLAGLARSGWSLRRSLDTAVEVSHAFVVPALLRVEGLGLGDRVAAWSARVAGVEGGLGRVHADIDELCFELYGISDQDRRAIVEGFEVSDGGDESEEGEADDEDADEAVVELDVAGLAAGLVSWAVGVAVGRFDVRLATGARDWPEEPDPFDPLPVCSPGMLTGQDGLPLLDPPTGYPVGTSPVLVDDPGHAVDVTARVRSVFDVVFGDDADEWWSDLGAVLGARGGDVGGWLRKGFFEHHLKTYSRSRRKAPVLWPIGTKSGSYLVWLYAHGVTGDSLFQVLHDVVLPKVSVEERELTRLRQEAGPSPAASQRKAIEAQERLVAELRDLRDELEAVAPLWAPDLDDGIVIVLAPLWRLFAHHRPWSNELKKHWAKLAKGDYDWAHLAMHLWPERVVPKCAEDRSLAIAHGLEDVFWARDNDNDDNWHPRPEPTTPIDTLIAQHTNPAITAALQRAAT